MGRLAHTVVVLASKLRMPSSLHPSIPVPLLLSLLSFRLFILLFFSYQSHTTTADPTAGHTHGVGGTGDGIAWGLEIGSLRCLRVCHMTYLCCCRKPSKLLQPPAIRFLHGERLVAYISQEALLI